MLQSWGRKESDMTERLNSSDRALASRLHCLLEQGYLACLGSCGETVLYQNSERLWWNFQCSQP